MALLKATEVPKSQFTDRKNKCFSFGAFTPYPLCPCAKTEKSNSYSHKKRSRFAESKEKCTSSNSDYAVQLRPKLIFTQLARVSPSAYDTPAQVRMSRER